MRSISILRFIGRVGLSEDEARRSGRKIRVGKRPMTRVARALEKGEKHRAS